MQLITAKWLNERGGLHDARVLDVRTVGSNVEIEFDDEWANERGLSQPEAQAAPGTLVVEGFSATQGEPSAAAGGWVSELSLRGDELDLAFCDRSPLSFRIGAAWWRIAA